MAPQSSQERTTETDAKVNGPPIFFLPSLLSLSHPPPSPDSQTSRPPNNSIQSPGLSELTKDDVQVGGDKAIPIERKRCGVISTSEEGYDNGGPVVPKVILYSGHPPNTKSFSTYCAMDIGLMKRKHREDPERNGDLEEDLFVLSIIWVQ
ncbi:hypothetical protein BGY98DRAFT_937308 [Russula aff. rugulosa BPL654]|nr:hypothetical protein BGY98DRAFT_937308 [Russula aff. rugulosa BPL654]